MTTKPNSLAVELHRTLESARVARAALEADAAQAALVLEAHARTRPAAFDEATAAAEIAQADFADRVDGSGHADAVRDRHASNKTERDAALAAFHVEHDRLSAEAAQLQGALVAADSAIADLIATRRAAVADAAKSQLEAEYATYREHIAGLIAGAQRIVALRTIVTEPERPANAARKFEAVALTLPAFNAVAEPAPAELAALGAQTARSSSADFFVRVLPEVFAERAREQFNSLTDELCGVTS